MAGWRTVLVTKPCRLSLKNLQLVYEPYEEERITVPLEDITVIVLETTQASLTAALLSKIAEKNIALFSCDSYHRPNAVFLPFLGHSRVSQIAYIQQNVSLPFKKRVWQKIIKSKISNHAQLLAYCGADNTNVKRLVDQVKSGDRDNLEAYAARVYWGLLFKKFRRDQKAMDPVNVALNYGYAIVRGAIARSLVAYGLLPVFGLFHRSELNAYNLADDLIEPFRVMVDKAVKTLETEDEFEMVMTARTKSLLLSVLHSEMMLDGELVTLLHASDVAAKTLVSAMRENDPTLLKLPTFA
ncbi:type II CRISPR-associated endonuclease Cas1 [Sulfurimonas sp. HSL1-6]|uniref:type II CRISPR-associated endonuclease Cas1 n=1 Tax=Thiomicrolovo immobilis TaxID=3131935 RepID=UPI0031F83744